jgi:hypothetical protein
VAGRAEQIVGDEPGQPDHSGHLLSTILCRRDVAATTEVRLGQFDPLAWPPAGLVGVSSQGAGNPAAWQQISRVTLAFVGRRITGA